MGFISTLMNGGGARVAQVHVADDTVDFAAAVTEVHALLHGGKDQVHVKAVTFEIILGVRLGYIDWDAVEPLGRNLLGADVSKARLDGVNGSITYITLASTIADNTARGWDLTGGGTVDVIGEVTMPHLPLVMPRELRAIHDEIYRAQGQPFLADRYRKEVKLFARVSLDIQGCVKHPAGYTEATRTNGDHIFKQEPVTAGT